MKKILFINLLTIFAMSYNQAQTFAPIGSEWFYQVNFVFSSTESFSQWNVKRDTIINNKLCSVVNRKTNHVSGDFISEFYVYEDENIVYIYDNSQDFTILFDFNKSIGEKWNTTLFYFNEDSSLSSCSFEVFVDYIDTLLINGINLKRMNLITENSIFNGTVIQSIGHLSRPFPDIFFHCTGYIEDYNYYNGLRCYKDDDLGFVKFDDFKDCDFENLSVKEINSTYSVEIYPNPTNDHINIILKNSNQKIKQYSLTDLTGNTLLNEKVNKNVLTFNLKSLNSGVYILVMDIDGKNSHFKIIKN